LAETKTAKENEPEENPLRAQTKQLIIRGVVHWL